MSLRTLQCLSHGGPELVNSLLILLFKHYHNSLQHFFETNCLYARVSVNWYMHLIVVPT